MKKGNSEEAKARERALRLLREENPEKDNEIALDADSIAESAYTDGFDDDEIVVETNEEKYHRVVKIAWLTAVFLVAVALSVGAFLLIRKAIPNGEQSTPESSGQAYESAELFGVVLSRHDTNVTVYSAAAHKTITFNLGGAKRITDEYGLVIGLDMIEPGRIVEVQYNSVDRAVSLFRYTARANIYATSGVTPPGEDSIKVNGSKYSVDSKLITSYHGKEFSPADITENMVCELAVLDGHLYRINVLYNTGILKLSTVPEEYYGSTLVITSEAGTTQRFDIDENSSSYTVTEGMSHYSFDKDDEHLAGGDIYIQGEKENLLEVLPLVQRRGTVKFSLQGVVATIIIGEQEYSSEDEIDLPYGSYDAIIWASDYGEKAIIITVEQAYELIVIDMNRINSNIVLSSDMSGTDITIDGAFVVTLNAKPITVTLDPGEYEVTASVEGYEPITMTVSMKANEADKVLYFTGFKKIQESSEPESESPEIESESEPESETSETESEETESIEEN